MSKLCTNSGWWVSQCFHQKFNMPRCPSELTRAPQCALACSLRTVSAGLRIELCIKNPNRTKALIPHNLFFLHTLWRLEPEGTPRCPLCQRWWQISCSPPSWGRWWGWRCRHLAAPPLGGSQQTARLQNTYSEREQTAGKTKWYFRYDFIISNIKSNHFKSPTSVAQSTSTVSWHHPHSRAPEHFHHLRGGSCLQCFPPTEALACTN